MKRTCTRRWRAGQRATSGWWEWRCCRHDVQLTVRRGVTRARNDGEELLGATAWVALAAVARRATGPPGDGRAGSIRWLMRKSTGTGSSGSATALPPDGLTLERAYGLGDRRWKVPFTVDARCSIASGTRGFTALTIMALIEAGSLSLLFSTTADVRALWLAFFDGRIASRESVELLVRPRSDAGDERCGLGFWLAGSGPMVKLEGYDAGVSFRSWHDPTTGQRYTVIGNTSEGAWPVLGALAATLGPC